MCAGRELHRQRPFAERIFSEILAEFCRCPGLSAIDRNRDFADALAAVERYSLQRHWARLQFRAIRHVGNERADGQAVDRDRCLGHGARLDASAGRVRNPIGDFHKDTVENVIDDSDFVQMFHPIGTVIAGHDQTKREAVKNRQILAVHAIGQHYPAIARVVDVERLDEIRRRVADRSIHPVEGDLLRALLHAGLIEHGLQRHAPPARIAHRAIAQLAAPDAWIEKPAAVARAFIDGNEFDRGKRFYFLQGQLEGTIDLALDLQREFIRIYVEGYICQMIADEKSIVRRNRAVVED